MLDLFRIISFEVGMVEVVKEDVKHNYFLWKLDVTVKWIEIWQITTPQLN